MMGRKVPQNSTRQNGCESICVSTERASAGEPLRIRGLKGDRDPRDYLHYDRESGVFTWKAPLKKIKVGDVAGTKSQYGYTYICFQQRKYAAHRMAWFFENGEFPEVILDHINGDRSDNRISNLRGANYSQNGANAKISKNNTSGIKGVTWDKRKKKWVAQIMKDRKNIFIGRYDSVEEAGAAYYLAAQSLFGEFAMGSKRAKAKAAREAAKEPDNG